MSKQENFETTVATYVAMLCEAFGRKPTKATFMAYEFGLQGVTAEQIKTACLTSLQQNRTFMPTPGELRELAIGGGQPFEAIAAAAWECLNRGIDRVGYSGSPNFADGFINATVRHLGGWERVCGLQLDEFEKWYRKDFERTYLQFLRNGCPADQLKYLPGAVERENGRWHGVAIPSTGKVYELPDVQPVGAPYKPQVLALPAPERTAVTQPQFEFRPLPTEAPAELSEKKSRMVKKEFPKHLQWLGKEDLEFELTPEQLETQAQNRAALAKLNSPA